MLKNNARITVLLSAIIALVISSFGTVPPVNAMAHTASITSMPNPILAGYGGVASPGEITHVTAEWTQPAVTCQPNLAEAQSEATGLGLIGGSSLGIHGAFIFTKALCSQGSSSPSYAAGLFFANPPTGITITLFTLTVNPGDTFSGSVTFSPSTLTFTANLTDLSTGQSASATVTETPQLQLPSVAVCAVGTFNAASALAQFTPVRFTNCAATVSGNAFTILEFSTVVRSTMVDSSGNTMATASHLSRRGSSFKVTWVSST